jgi:acetyl-CoA carboxylase biotin carboxyl carrier protein
MVDWELVKRLIKVVKEEDISGLAVEEKGVKYEVKREVGGVAYSVGKSAATSVEAPKPHPHVEAKQVEEDEGLLAITSPMVGTFYRSPSPEAPSFVEIGADVEPGKTVCIIEAMKLFNEIEAEVRGKVVKILVENGKPVEYGQKLMLIKKA